MNARITWTMALLGLGLTVAPSGCEERIARGPLPADADHREAEGAEDGDGDSDEPLTGPCPLGATHACSVHNEAGCSAGTQYCMDGLWSECRRDVSRSLYKRDLSDQASACGEDGTSANACDPSCQGIAPEPPDFGGGTDSGTADPTNSLPPEARAAGGLDQPCNSDRDCQFDHHCAAGPSPRSCQPYGPGEGAASCGTKYDLTAGMSCLEGALPTVPVCNRGNATLSRADLVGMRVKHQVAPRYDMGSCALAGNGVRECAIPATADLPVGACIDVPCAELLPNSRIYVDAGNGNSRECQCGNNWSFYTGVPCGIGACGATIATAEEIPVTILIAMDVSGSMDSGSPSRLASVQSAMQTFAEDPASGGVGVALKFWPEGRCDSPGIGAGACDADGPYVDEGSCASHPCESSSAPLGAACRADVSTVCGTPGFERCCGQMPAAGSCAVEPCTTSPAPLAKGCVTEVSTTCNQKGLERCCGGWTGSCNADPCSTSASSFSSCDNNSNPEVAAVCNDYGFERCCGGELASTGAWGTSRAPCTVAANKTMTCRNASGTAVACSTLTIPAQESGSRAARMKAFLAIANNANCATGWSATCVASFRTYWNSVTGSDPCGPTQWDSTCVARWRAKAPANACEKTWDAACSADYATRVASSATKKCTQTKRWDDSCVVAFDESTGGACTACDHPSLPAGAGAIDDYRFELTASPRTSMGGNDDAEEAVVRAIQGAQAGGSTPTYPALDGAIDFCRSYQAGHPGERAVVVFATDGEPSGCNPSGKTSPKASDLTAIQNLASRGKVDDIFTYAVGIQGSNATFMNGLASSGGTSAAFMLGSGSQATSDLNAALTAIRNQFSCSYALPDGSTPSDVTVRWNDGGLIQTIGKVSNLAECGAISLGYYPESSTTIALCPATCERIRSVTGSRIEVLAGCGQAASAMTFTEVFSAGDACAEGTGTFPQWTVMLYDANVPSGSSIRVQARTRVSVSEPWRSLHEVVKITDANENATPGAPVSLNAALGAEAFARDIELTMTSSVAGGAPELLAYELQFTCAASE